MLIKQFIEIIIAPILREVVNRAIEIILSAFHVTIAFTGGGFFIPMIPAQNAMTQFMKDDPFLLKLAPGRPYLRIDGDDPARRLAGSSYSSIMRFSEADSKIEMLLMQVIAAQASLKKKR